MKRLFAIILIVSASICLRAQQRMWDTALDQYQQICDECISIRTRAAAGESVQLASMTQLLMRLTGLRKTLKDAEGQMTPAQQLRFESIRMRYEEVFRSRREPPRLPYLPGISCVAQQLEHATLVPDERPAPTGSGMGVPSSGSARFGVLIYAGMPDMYYGTMLNVSFKGTPLGAFVRASVSIPYRQGEYECRSDGTTGSGYIWTNGNECLSRWSVAAGVTVSPVPIISIYAGGGYGKRIALWQDASGRWATVEDRSVAGFTADAGVIFNLNRLNLLAGVSAIGFAAFSAELGLGISF